MITPECHEREARPGRRTDRAPSLLAACGVWLIRRYQRWLSPMLGNACRFHPSCSEYTILAIKKHGFCLGVLRGAWRICRCNPFHPGGVDYP